MNEQKRKKVIVIGGSLGGLFAGTTLRKIGWDVEIYERSEHDLDSRGGGIVLQHEVVEILREVGVDVRNIDLGVKSEYRTTFKPNGEVVNKSHSPQKQTSWSLVYSLMIDVFGKKNYHKGKKLTSIKQSDKTDSVTAYFDDGTEDTADMLIGADGNGSTVRSLLWPDDKPTYAGYIAWRGLITENEIPLDAADGLVGDFGFSNNLSSHMLGYLVPGENNDTRKGHRLYNWVWYRPADENELKDAMTDINNVARGYSIPEGMLSNKWIETLKEDANELLPPNFKSMVMATKNPFGQAIRDLTVDQMVKDKVILLGDSAFIPRPHTAASTSKAAVNALMLADCLFKNDNNVEKALKEWEPNQLKLGNNLYMHGTRIGNRLMFNS